MVIENATEETRSWVRLDGVDLLRGVAILLVLLNHVNMRLFLSKIHYTKGLPEQLVSSLVWSGQYGVQIFFAVSGFLITSTTLRRWGSVSRVNVRDFYRLRFARIAPLLLALLAILSGLHLAGVKDFVVWRTTGGLGRALIAALTFHINVLEARRGYLPASWDVLWSLSVEEMFYLFFPLACRLFRRTRWLSILLLAFVAVGPFARQLAFRQNPVWGEYSYLGGMDAIALGCLTALALNKLRLSERGLWVLGGTGAALMVFILAFSIRAEQSGLGRKGLTMSILATGVCMVIAVLAQSQWRAPVLLRPLVTMGQRSYEIYLTHMFAVLGVFSLFVMAGSTKKSVPILFVSIIVVAALLGELVARIYSERMNRWLRARWGDGAETMGSVMESAKPAEMLEVSG